MKTIQVNIYSIEELSEQSQEYAYKSWKELNDYYIYDNDFQEALQEFQNTFDVEICDGGYDVVFNDENVQDLAGVRLYKYLVNNYPQLFDEPYKCWVSGFWVDEYLLSPMIDFINKPYDITFKELVQECAKNFEKSYYQEREHYFSFEGFLEDSKSLDNYYFENGALYKAN